MEYIKWEDKFSVKVAMIDEQHKRLFQIINSFYNNVVNKSSDDEIGKILHELKEYAMMHFQTEEFYLRQWGLGIFDEHKKEHDAFIKEVNDMIAKHKAGKIVMSFDIMKYIKRWITEHVTGTDMKYTVIFNNNGLR